MKVVDHIKQSKSTLFSIEILPPLKGKSIQSIYNIIDPLQEFKPSFVDVTYHREEYVYKKREGGFLEKISTRKRPGTVGICAAIMNRYKIDTVPHIICGGFTKEETESALIDLQFLGIDNVLALRGDAVKNERSFIPEPGGNAYAIDLVKQIVNMNKGKYLYEDDGLDVTSTDFCIGVAAYAEKHFEAPNMIADMRHLKAKVDAGAGYIVTQMFYDNQKYFDFVKKCREMDINVPIIPGLKVMTTKSQASILPKTFFLDIPQDMMDAIDKCKNDAEAKEVGIEWATSQAKELIKFGAPVLHFYTMGSADPVKRVISKVF
jgi:methylenetetrahydrofolate reductase (NADPH)